MMGTNGQMSLHTGNVPSCHSSLDGMQQGNTDNSVLPHLAELDKTFVRRTYPDPESEEPVFIYL